MKRLSFLLLAAAIFTGAIPMLIAFASCSGGGGPANTPTPAPSESPSPSTTLQVPPGLLQALETFAREQGADLLGPCETVPPSKAGVRDLCYLQSTAAPGGVTIQVGTPFSGNVYVLVFRVADDGSYILVSATGPAGT